MIMIKIHEGIYAIQVYNKKVQLWDLQVKNLVLRKVLTINEDTLGKWA